MSACVSRRLGCRRGERASAEIVHEAECVLEFDEATELVALVPSLPHAKGLFVRSRPWRQWPAGVHGPEAFEPCVS
jgi:hypothetical protein